MQTVKTDVLVIGGGGAAARAAFEAVINGARVILATKGSFGAVGTRGAGATAGGASAASVFATPGWTGSVSEIEKRISYMAVPPPDLAYRNIIQAGLGMADPELVRVLIEDAVPARQALLDLGATFDEPGMRSHGVPLMAALVMEIRRRDITVMPRTMIVRLLVKDGECCGAVGINEITGEAVAISAGATIIGTGGDANLFMLNLGTSCTTGDGYVLAYEAGAELMNLEFKQIFLGTIYPTRNMLTRPLPPGARLTNSDGEEFLAGYLHDVVSPEDCMAQRNRHNPFSTRDELSRYVDFAIIGEVKAGRSTQRGGVYLDISASPPSGPQAEFWEYRGIDFSRPVEIGVCQHCSLGGLRIDADARTTVPRLYAAGEATAGPHGADRMGGHMLLASQVFGARAGRHAAADTAGKKVPDFDGSVLKDSEAKIDMYRDLHGSYSPSQVKLELRRSAYFSLLVIRTKKGLTDFLSGVDRIRQEMAADISISGPEDLVEALELHNLLSLAEIEAHACLTRTESRGPHYRADFPVQDDVNWRKNVVVRKVDEELRTDIIALDPDWQDIGDESIGYWG